jgi:hypothetical protein
MEIQDTYIDEHSVMNSPSTVWKRAGEGWKHGVNSFMVHLLMYKIIT